MPQFFATCATSLEYLLVDELKDLGATEVKEGLSIVNFDAEWQTVYNILMWTRTASRILYPIAKFEAKDEQTLYDQVSIIDWSQHISSNSSFLVNAQSFRSELSHTKFVAQRVKDAIVDHYTNMDEPRPDVAFEQPEVVIQVRIRQNNVILSIDFAGVGLHQRGYRSQGGSAPIKENLAAALLLRASWQKQIRECKHQELTLYDPMCGSGTFLIEAAMMALDIAPGKKRDYLGLFGWLQFRPELWTQTLEQASQKELAGTQNCNLTILGSDINPKVITIANANIVAAGVEKYVSVRIAALDQIDQFELPKMGLVIVNPPYSERLGEFSEVKSIYQQLGQLLKAKFSGWKASVLSPNKEFGHSLGIRAKKIYKFNNGSIPCELLNFDLVEDNFIIRKNQDSVDKDFKTKLSEPATQLCNRIEKNRKKLKKYLVQNAIQCYRIYDADLPEYNAAIDVYSDKIHIQEYRAPKTIDEKVAIKRIKDIQRVVAGIFQIPADKIYLKQRRQQKGDWQYETKGRDQFGAEMEKDFFTIEENERKFRVNLKDYLDTGLFLDHRKLRLMIADAAKGKRLLNLFCYTGSISVYAATAGATQTVNVDMSNTYLNWAKENFELNSIDFEQHLFYRDDSLKWLVDAIAKQDKYDLIFLDPPTFSNSKKMEQHFDVQRDHCLLIEQCLQLLNPNGCLYFSNNFHQFKMQFLQSNDCSVKEITKQTTSADFLRKPLHRCWKIELNG